MSGKHAMNTHNAVAGFSLTEVLISLLIIAEIATFSIPKVLQAQQYQQFRAVGKETAGMITSVHQQLQLNGQLSINTKPTDFTPYLNYISLDTSGTIDDVQTAATRNCTSSTPCVKLHNGGKLYFYSQCFGSTTNGVIFFQIDPDGKTDGTATGPGKSMTFILQYNGRLTDWSGITLNSTECGGYVYNSAWADSIPPWFNWN